MKNNITLKAKHGYSLSVPASLRCITTYVLLEQERWFEFEVDFLLRYIKPGMTAVDIGANLGVYSLPIAAQAGANGAVFAYEPGSEARECLRTSAILNGLSNLHISACALSNRSGRLWLAYGSSSELNELKPGGADDGLGEMVDVVTLDVELDKHGWTSVDFIKIDAEGQEARIVLGGRKFFAEHSPLIMYEVVDAGQANHQLRWVFEVLDYRTYRLSGDSSYLVRVDDDDQGTGFDLNYFSAKADRAARLMADGLLVETVDSFVLSSADRAAALTALLKQPFAMELGFGEEDFADTTSPYLRALLAYAAYLYLDWAAQRRHAALVFAYNTLHALPSDRLGMAGLATLARVAESLHYRAEAVGVLDRLRNPANEPEALSEPFFPASRRFEQLPVADEHWFGASVIDAWVRLGSYSTMFVGQGAEILEWLATSAYADAEVRRRAWLLNFKLSGQGLASVDFKPDSLNPGFWEKDAERVRGLAEPAASQ